MSLTSIILTKNEEVNIEPAIRSVGFCNETIVIDDFSKDKTIEVVKKLGAKAFQRHLDNDFSAQRNFGLSKAKGDWVLFIDADERVSENLAKEIKKKVTQNNPISFRIKREDYLWGEELKYSADRFHPVRLARKGAGLWQGKVHEIWNVKGKVKTLEGVLKHYPHKTLHNFIEEINFYSTIRAKELLEKGQRSSLFKIVFWPKAKFLETWIWKKGILNGTKGFVISLIMSLHSFLAWGKVWFLQRSLQKNH